MNAPRYSRQVARLLSSIAGNAEAPSGDRARGIATLERAIVARQKSRVVRLWLLAAATFALVASGGIWLAGPVSSTSAKRQEAEPVSVTVSTRGAGAKTTPGDTPLHDGERLVPGSAVNVNPQGAATLALSTGTRVELESDSSLLAQELDRHQRFYLSKGAFEAKVAKLSAGQRFVVQTPDAEIEVRGTRFRLEVHGAPDGCDVRTLLQVHEGVVEVRAKGGVVRIGAGQSWPEPCHADERHDEPSRAPPANEPAPVQAPGAGVSPGDRALAHRTKSAEAPEPEPSSSSALVEQNDLFAEGVAARRRGDAAGAISAYGRLMQKYPNSALVENAMVERMRLFARRNPPLAREEARRYLERYPSGFARAEAERTVSGSP